MALSLAARIEGASTLDDLRHILNEAHYSDAGTHLNGEYGDLDFCSLPTFGGDEPADTQGIYSWDETRYLIQAGLLNNEWMMIPRKWSEE